MTHFGWRWCIHTPPHGQSLFDVELLALIEHQSWQWLSTLQYNSWEMSPLRVSGFPLLKVGVNYASVPALPLTMALTLTRRDSWQKCWGIAELALIKWVVISSDPMFIDFLTRWPGIAVFSTHCHSWLGWPGHVVCTRQAISSAPPWSEK